MPRKSYHRAAAELTLIAPQVIAHRWRDLSPLQSTARARREQQRMVTEKIAATQESMLAMAFEVQKAQTQALTTAWVNAATSGWRLLLGGPAALWSTAAWSTAAQQHQHALQQIAASGIEPVHRTARANLRRLSRHRR